VEAERDRLERASAGGEDGRVRALVARVDADEVRAPREGEVDRLAARAQDGDAAARERLIELLLPFVRSLARRYRTDGLDETDLLQEGVVGFLRALARWDRSRGVPFDAYARWWIRQALQEARSDFVRPLRLPPKALRQLARLKSEHQRIYRAERRSAPVAELARLTSIDRAQAESLVAADARPRSLDEDLPGDDGTVGTLGDLLEDPLSAAAYEEVLDAVAGEQLRALLGRLTDREREIVRARFGFDAPAETLAEIGGRLGISAERVRQVEERALAKLRRG
jgi:RNA polymerase primary sigma factor